MHVDTHMKRFFPRTTHRAMELSEVAGAGQLQLRSYAKSDTNAERSHPCMWMTQSHGKVAMNLPHAPRAGRGVNMNCSASSACPEGKTDDGLWWPRIPEKAMARSP